MRRFGLIAALLCLAHAAGAQTIADDPNSTMQEIDECGVLVAGMGCVLFEGAGGQYVIADAGDFNFGDAVRVVGMLDTNCMTICGDADGCIRGAVLYDPAVLPCGTDLPNFPGDLISGLCTAASSVLLALTLVGLWSARHRAHAPGAR